MGSWYMSRKEIEENSPSRKDGIDSKIEKYLRMSYAAFLKDLGMRLKLPQEIIATAILFCQRFFLRQSHAKNDHRTIATACMFLASKVKESCRHLQDIILVSYEMIHQKNPAAAQRIKQKKVYKQQKELILLGERIVLTTLDFEMDAQHPYGFLRAALKKLHVANSALLQVAWNLVSDGLSLSLCLQFMPNHIAASAFFLAAKYLKVKLPSGGEKAWWRVFDITPRQLEEISIQLLNFYEEVEVRTRAATKSPAANEEQVSKQISSHPAPQHPSAENNAMRYRGTKNQSTDESKQMGSDITDHKMDLKTRDSQNSEKLPQKDNKREVANKSKYGTGHIVAGDQNRMVGRNVELREGPFGHSTKEAFKMIDKDKLKAAFEKRRKERGEIPIKKDVMDEDDLIEMELEDGVELAVENEKNYGERRQMSMKGQLQKDMIEYNAEEGEVIDDASPLLNSRKRKTASPPDRQPQMKKRLVSSYHNQR